MSADRWRSMAQRMLAGPMGSTVQWTRRVLSSNGPEGTVSVTSSTTHSVRVAQLGAKASDMFGTESWQTAQVRLVMAAKGLPFGSETHSGFPEVRFDDLVTWLGVQMRVVAFESWAAPGGVGGAPEPAIYFVGLAS